jgi:signal transduction histidine kinase
LKFSIGGFWRDRRPAVVVINVVVGEALLIGGLLLEHRRRRRAEVEARRHLATMAHLDRRAAMGELATGLAHELNQPLGAILRNAEAAKMMLASSAPALDQLRDIVDDIRSDDRRAAGIIRSMRTLLRKQDIHALPVDLNAVARETVEFLEPDAASKGVRVSVDVPPHPSVVRGDRVHLQQVVLNLLLNSVDAVTGSPADRRRVLVRTACSNGHVDLAVTDTGPGFSPDALSHLFEPFFSTKAHGMGMGLSIVRSIVEAHGGRVTGANNADRGATVRITLPRRDNGATSHA